MNPVSPIPLIAIVGPTAAGKSDLAINLAQRFDGEIVNADSRLVYRHMDIGTAKPSAAELGLVPHDLVNIADPGDNYSLALYLVQATQAVRDIHSRGKLPILAGGTGQYVRALLEGFSAPQVPPNPSLRASLEADAQEHGSEALWNRLQDVDPEAAERIDHRNVRRVIRAMEVYLETGVPFSRAGRLEKPPYSELIIGLTLERKALYARIDRRVEAMVEGGWPQEVSRLLEMGYSPELPSMSSLGYRDMAAYLGGEQSLEEAVERIKTATRRFARSQYAWFRLNDPEIFWLDAGDRLMDEAFRLTAGFLSDPNQQALPDTSETVDQPRSFGSTSSP